MSRVVAVAAFVVALGACPAGQVKPDVPTSTPLPPTMLGGWGSSCFAMPNADGTDGFARTEFDLQATTWSLELTWFADELCATRIGSTHIGGGWQLERASTTLPGAFEARFDFAEHTITAHVDGFIAFLQSMSCGKSPYSLGGTQNILETGCPTMGFLPVASCASDFDLVFVNGSTLQFGQRPADNNMCTADKRPRALGAPLNRLR